MSETQDSIDRWNDVQDSAKLKSAIRAALRDLDHATPRQRNGPCIRAADRLRGALGLSPMAVPGGKPSEGLEAIER